MKILHVVSYLHPHIGGIEQTARDIMNALSEDPNVEQRAICFASDRKTVSDTLDGVPVVRCGAFAKVSSQSLSFSYGRQLRRIMRTFAPDCVIFHYPNPFLASALLRALKKRPACRLILWWHLDITKQRLLGKLFNGQTHRLLRRATRVIATSPNYIEGSKFLPAYRDKCTVIPSCIRDSRLQITEDAAKKAREIRETYRGKIICCFFGRHVAYKGLEYLIDAAKLLDDRFVFLIGGSGELTESYRTRAADTPRIRFLGRLDDEDLHATLLASDIFCFPSVTKNEAFGLALAEAMYEGKPCVTFTIEGSGVNYVSIGGQTGLEVANRDTAAYADALRRLAEDGELRARLGAAAAARAKELFLFPRFADSVRGLVAATAEEE